MIDTLELLLAPLAAGFLATLTHAVLGREVLARGIVFIDLAIAQCAVLGALSASLLHLHGVEATMATTSAALLGALAVAGMCAWWPARREALIGTLYIATASLATVLASRDPHGIEQINRLLAGDVLWASWSALIPLAVASVVLLMGVLIFGSLLKRDLVFYPVFAVLVSLSLPLLGLYLVFATLIIPALAGSVVSGRPLQAAIAGGLAGYLVGLIASAFMDWPSGPTVVLSLLAMGLPMMVLWRHRA